MIWIPVTTGAAIRQRTSPFDEDDIQGAHSLVYQPGVQPLVLSENGLDGTFARGLARVKGYIFVCDANAAETLLSTSEEVDIIVRYVAQGIRRKRTLLRALFVGDATVAIPAAASEPPEPIGVPFRLQIPMWEELSEHIQDSEDTQP